MGPFPKCYNCHQTVKLCSHSAAHRIRKKSSTIAASQKFLNLCICSVIKLTEKRFVLVYRLIG